MNISTKISAALAVAAISAAFMGYSNTASAASLRDTCHGTTRSAVEDCCNTWVRRNGTPMWMISEHGGCHAAAACSGGGGSNLPGIAANFRRQKCYIDQTPPDTKSGPLNTPASPGGGGNLR